MTMPAATAVITLADRLGLRVAVAESLTGGMLASALIEVPGASHVVSGGVVAYDTSLKASLLGVSAALLVRVGPVDAEVGRQMAAGVRRACAVPRALSGQTEPPTGEAGGDTSSEDMVAVYPADIGLATTGVAGPDPDPQTGLPGGTVWIGVSSLLGERAVPLQLIGTRSEIRSATVAAALHELAAELDSLRSARAQESWQTTLQKNQGQIHADSSDPQE